MLTQTNRTGRGGWALATTAVLSFALLGGALLIAGCNKGEKKEPEAKKKVDEHAGHEHGDDENGDHENMTTDDNTQASNTGALKPYPLNVCLVSGEEFGGEMGEPVVKVYDGQEIKFCCKSCIKTFEENKAKYLAELAAKAGGDTSAPSGDSMEHMDMDHMN